MQQAFVVLARDRILRVGQIEGNGPVFHHDRGARPVEKVSKQLAERFWGHRWELSSKLWSELEYDLRGSNSIIGILLRLFGRPGAAVSDPAHREIVRFLLLSFGLTLVI